MVFKVIVPDLGATGGDVLLTQWLVAEGQFVESGTPLFVVETDKATDEVQAFRSGYVRAILSQDGAEVELGSVVALMTDTVDEPYEDGKDDSRDEAEAEVFSRSPEPKHTSSPGLHAAKLRASPRARKLAEERSIDLSQVPASSADGVISVADVERFAAAGPSASEDRRSRRIPLTSHRRAIAEVTVKSKTQIPHFYLFVELDMTGVVDGRQQLIDRGQSPPTITELAVFAAAKALENGSQLNARYIDGHLEIFDDVDVGLMIGLESGVIAPVLRQASGMSLDEIRIEIRRLRERAQAGELSIAEIQGGVLSISNLGMHSVDYFAGVIQPGQSSLLSIGQMKKRQEYVGDRLEPRWMMTACISVDHRVADGVGAAAFMNEFKRRLESWSAA